MNAELILVIRTDLEIRGNGTEDDPKRIITQSARMDKLLSSARHNALDAPAPAAADRPR